jgi:parallel beta-helix repeat protein
MNKTRYRIASLIIAFAILLGNHINTQAAVSVYYVSPTGNDANPGTATAPFRTFAKANSVLTAGSTLNIYAGTYNEQLIISKSGTGSAWIMVKPVSGVVVIDMRNLTNPAVNISGSYVVLNNLDVRGSNDVCVRLAGKYIHASGLIVHECRTHGIYTPGQHIEITGNTVYRTSLSNQLRNLSSGWGSGIKVGLAGDDILIKDNKVYNNYGEGIAATRGSNVMIRGNNVYDNFSVNIYVDNSFSISVEENFVTCHPNSGFERNGSPAVGVGMAEEFYTDWGAKLNHVTITNNIVAFCKNGVRYNGASDSLVGGGLKNITVAYNTLYGSTNSALSVAYESAQAGSLIANNIVWQAQNILTYIDNPAGLTFKNNQWKVLPSSSVRSPGDRIGDPRFVSTPGYTAESYRPGSTSPAAAGAADIGISNDFFAQPRGPLFDMGSIQFTSAIVTSTPGAAASSTPVTVTRTNTPLASTPTAVSPTTTPTIALTSTPLASTPTAIPPTATPTIAFTSTPTQPSITATIQSASQEVTYDNQNSAFVYSTGWTAITDKAAFGGSFAQTSTDGSSVTFPFTGQSFSVIYNSGPNNQKMNVLLDGNLMATIDESQAVSQNQKRWDFPGQFPFGQHTLKLVFVTTSSNTNGSVDAVIVR